MSSEPADPSPIWIEPVADFQEAATPPEPTPGIPEPAGAGYRSRAAVPLPHTRDASPAPAPPGPTSPTPVTGRGAAAPTYLPNTARLMREDAEERAQLQSQAPFVGFAAAGLEAMRPFFGRRPSRLDRLKELAELARSVVATALISGTVPAAVISRQLYDRLVAALRELDEAER